VGGGAEVGGGGRAEAVLPDVHPQVRPNEVHHLRPLPHLLGHHAVSSSGNVRLIFVEWSGPVRERAGVAQK
jgi:hypothetical protein